MYTIYPNQFWDLTVRKNCINKNTMNTINNKNIM